MGMQNKLNGYFCGWYFKLQSEDVTVALIPAFHRTRKGNFCTLQFISNDLVQVAEFPYEALKLRKRPLSIDIGGNTFSEKGIHLDVDKEGLSLKGEISFGPWSPLRGGDIMGPFAMVPFMQCRHGVLSTSHSADGWIDINGRRYSFAGARGYIEGDRGYSFPSVYLWTQCLFDDGSLMLSVADIPMGLFHFTGIIGFVHHSGKQWRIATYKGRQSHCNQGWRLHYPPGRYCVHSKAT